MMTGTVWAKTALREFRGNWQRIPVSEIPAWVSRIPADRFRNGADAVYLGVKVRDDDGAETVWLCLDVEAHGSHYNVSANLEAGRDLLAFIIDNDLVECLIILLSGWGLRFCWPYRIGLDDVPAFLEFVSERPEIDASIYNGDKFVRLAGYRGHFRQQKDGEVDIDRHVHKLPDVHALWRLTPEEYLTLTDGPADLSNCLEWIPDTLPIRPLPDVWKSFLETYRDAVELAGTLFSGTRLKVQKRFRPVPEILEEHGIEFKTEQSGEVTYYRLKRDCPACGKAEGRAWVTAGGRLRCWRASCDAGQPAGLPMAVWLPGADVLSGGGADTVPEMTGEVMAIEAARRAIVEAVGGANDTAIQITPGGGKSTSTLKALLADGLTGRVVMAVPEKILGRELIETARGINPDTDVVLLEGRNLKNCRSYAKVERVASRGFSPAFLVCPRCKKDGDCDYFTNQTRAFEPGDRLVITSHAGLITGVDWDKSDFGTMIIDESPLSTFIQTQAAPWGSIQRIAGMIDPSGRKIIGAIDKVILRQLSILEKHKTNRFTISRLYAGMSPAGSQWADRKNLWHVSKVTDGAREKLLRSLAIFEAWADDGTGRAETTAAWQRRLFKARVDLGALEILWALLAGADHSYLQFSQDRKNPVTLCQTVKRLPKFTGKLVHLDGTLDRDEASALLERDFHIIDGRCDMPGLKSVWIRQGGGKLKLSKMNDEQLSGMLKAADAHISDENTGVLIGTHLKSEPSIRDIAKDALPGRMVDVTHYFCSRGRNHWQEFRSFIGMGTPTLPESGMLDTGFFLFPDDPEKRETWRVNLGHRETVQMAHRIRPIQGNKNIIILGREWPTGLPAPNLTIDRRRGDKVLDSAQGEAYRRLAFFIGAFGFIHRETMLMIGVGLEKDLDLIPVAVESLSQCIQKHPFTSGVSACFTFIYNIRKTRSESLSKMKDNEGFPVVFRDRGAIRDILDKLQAETGLPALFYSSKMTDGKRSRGLGFLDNARRFYEMMGVPWASESWQGTESGVNHESMPVV